MEPLAGGGRIDARRLLNGRRIERADTCWQNREPIKTVRPVVAPRPRASQRNLLQEVQASERRLLRQLREGLMADDLIEGYDRIARMAREENTRWAARSIRKRYATGVAR